MIGYLRGQILDNQDGKLIVVPGMGAAAASGMSGSAAAQPNAISGAIGYTVLTVHGPEIPDFAPGKVIELFIHTHVREDALDLYGFISRSEKELFLSLTGVTGIGPKGAMSMIAKAGCGTLLQAILDGDKEMLTQVPGIGKKTAERVVLDAADSLRKKMDAGLLHDVRPAKLQKAKVAGATSAKLTGGAAIIRDAKEALLGLGYKELEVGALLGRALEGVENPSSVEELIRLALTRATHATEAGL